MPQIKVINAVLVRLNISLFPNTRTDKEITDEVRVNKKLGIGAGKWTRYKFPKEALAPISEKAGEIYRWHRDHTSPWEEGLRLLNVVGMSKYQESVKKQTGEFFELVDAFGASFKEWMAEARLMHGPTFDMADYPAGWKAMREYFAVNAEFEPVPKADAFAVRGIAESALQAMKSDLENRVEQRIQQATADTWKRLMAPVQHMADVLQRDDPRVFETLITNITGICDLVPSLNIASNESLNSAAQRIRDTISRVNLEQLRENRATRKEIAVVAKQLVAQFGQLGQRKFAA